MSEKSLKYCVEYARLSMEIKRLTKAIGDSLDGCPGENGKRYAISLEDGSFIYGGDQDNTHLKAIYTPETVDDGSGNTEHKWLSEKEIRERLACCPGCLAAHEAIQARKAARKSFGALKRAIMATGRAEIKKGAA